MPIKKTTPKAAATKKDTLKKLTVPALRAKAKRAGIKLSKTDGSQKTKAQLVLALDKVPAPKKKATTRRRKDGPLITGPTTMIRDVKREAMKPGKRVSKTGRVYYERRANRSDVSQFLDNATNYAQQLERLQVLFGNFSVLLDLWYMRTDSDITEKLLDIPELIRDVKGIEESLSVAYRVLKRYDSGKYDDNYDPSEDDRNVFY